MTQYHWLCTVAAYAYSERTNHVAADMMALPQLYTFAVNAYRIYVPIILSQQIIEKYRQIECAIRERINKHMQTEFANIQITAFVQCN